MRLSVKSIWKQFWYDLVIFFREPFFALPILFLPGLFFVVYAGSMAKSYGNIDGFAQYIPMYMILISFLTVFFNIGTQYVTDKQSGIFKRLILSPISLFNLVLTYSLRGILISVLGFFEMIAIAVFVFKIPLSDNMVMFFLAFLISVVIMMLLSLTLHGFFKNSRQVMPFTILGFQYVLFASGMIMPVDKMPKVLQYFVYVNPVYHMNKILVRVWYRVDLELINILALAAWVAVCIILIHFQKGLSTDK
ncbi:ABC transporter permease [Butyrivibrio sp. YAB3001]|uniref:ABC transporter permease n=1 Tax=Butyrivibrio sp. YAB3001 TaxID=1520812 RepID=UPI0008F62ED1|nr:ABC transporter permease [Butyrivibrio sp. YAB3001]SFB83320.1 ABC-2 type transporter [Butyrivibrio sp. YAB3001]